MDGPRTLRPEERASLMHLVDQTFVHGESGAMFRAFPRYFAERNDDHHWVFVEDNQVIAHAGVMPCHAMIEGCPVHVGCVGAVACRESHRGQGLASQLMAALYENAVTSGMDFLLISGDQSLYRRMGAVPFSHDYDVTVNAEAANRAQHVPVRLAKEDHPPLPAWERAYAEKSAHFVRNPEDWRLHMIWHVDTFVPARMFSVYVGAGCAGYIVASRPDADGHMNIMEFAGHPPAVQSAIAPLLQCENAQSLRVPLQQADNLLLNNLRAAGAHVVPGSIEGVVLLVCFARFMERMRPCFEKRVGKEAAGQLHFAEENGHCVFSDASSSYSLTRAEAAQVVFGGPHKRALPGIWGRVFPLPLLAYGINYV